MHLTDIPIEIFLDNLLPFASARDVLSFGSTNKLFAAICADETFWKRRCQEDFNFTSQETARQSGWKNLYRGLNHPRIFVWGFVTMPVHAAQTMMLFTLLSQRAQEWETRPDESPETHRVRLPISSRSEDSRIPYC